MAMIGYSFRRRGQDTYQSEVSGNYRPLHVTLSHFLAAGNGCTEGDGDGDADTLEKTIGVAVVTPFPSSTVIDWFAFTSLIVCRSPLGQTISRLTAFTFFRRTETKDERQLTLRTIAGSCLHHAKESCPFIVFKVTLAPMPSRFDLTPTIFIRTRSFWLAFSLRNRSCWAIVGGNQQIKIAIVVKSP